MQRIVGIRAAGPEDPDGTRSAEILGAYFRLEEMRALCRRLWRWLGALAIGWTLAAALTTGLSLASVGIVFAMFSVVAVGAMVAEWWAEKSLSRMVRTQPRITRS